MASYKRVLKAFGRSEKDADFICNVPIHPWEIKIKKFHSDLPEQWDGNIRLVGYIDVFFLILYQGESRFEHGIVIYKDEKDPRLLELKAKPQSVIMNEKSLAYSQKDERKKKTKEKPEIETQFDTDSLNYIVNGWGHDIGLRTTFPPAEIYTIYIRQSPDSTIEKALRQHNAIDLLMDTAAIATVSTAEVMGNVVGLANSRHLEDARDKFKEGMSTKRAPSVAHSGSRE